MLEIIEGKLHSAFLQGGNTPDISYSIEMEETTAALEAGWLGYWQSPRYERARILAARRIRAAIQAMRDWDMAHRPR